MKKVYGEIKNCCGCGACSANCPQKAINMVTSEQGFVYPVINHDLCIDCGLCVKTCTYQSTDNKIDRLAESITTYVAINSDSDLLNQCASGGIFSAISYSFLQSGGVVCGASMKIINGTATIEHIVITQTDELPKLQGSKYVQSNMWTCLPVVKAYLDAGKKVLFSGTPCQVDTVKHLFSKYNGNQLFTIDIICHGVPGQLFFNDYLKELSKQKKAQITKFEFRNKQYGWGKNGIIQFSDGHYEKLEVNKSSYYRYFFDGETYRENCYSCHYASLNRPGDITIGDYWGVEKYDSHLLSENGGWISKEKGVSCLLINSEFGEKLLREYGKLIRKERIELNHVLFTNKQLREPATHTKLRKSVLNLWLKKGYGKVEKRFQRMQRKNKIKKCIAKWLSHLTINRVKQK